METYFIVHTKARLMPFVAEHNCAVVASELADKLGLPQDAVGWTASAHPGSWLFYRRDVEEHAVIAKAVPHKFLTAAGVL